MNKEDRVEPNQEKDRVVLNWIDTSVAAENFAALLKEKKCYFLDGTWGSGKTEFLSKAEKMFPPKKENSKKEHSKKKFTYLDLWRVKNNRSVIQIAFCKLHPIIFFGIKVLFIASVAVMLLSTGKVHLGLTNGIKSTELINIISVVKKAMGFVGLLVLIYQFFKVKSDEVYIYLLNWIPSQKILVIDDFDRINDVTQEQAYKLFNVLDGKIPIVFVGDFTKFSEDEVSYLQKIIYKKVTLPFDIQPQNIWRNYKRELEMEITKRLNLSTNKKFSLDPELFNILETTRKNLRDRERFNDMINQELFEHEKVERVQIDEQLLIIYLYLFHPDKYEALRNYRGRSSYKKMGETSIDNAIQAMLDSDVEKYPLPFNKNKTAYLIYESVGNLSILEADKIITNDKKLRKNLLSNVNEDFYQYLTSHYDNYKWRHKKMFDMVVQHVKNRERSDLMLYIFEKNVSLVFNQGLGDRTKDNNSISPAMYNSLSAADQVESRKKFLKYKNLDLSEIVYMLTNLDHFSYGAIKDHFEKLELNIVEDYTFKDAILLLYLAQNELWQEYNSWDDRIIKYINNLTPKEFINFAEKVMIIKLLRENVVKVNMHVTIGYDEEGVLESRIIRGIVNKLKPSFDKLEAEGYSVTYSPIVHNN